MCYKCYNIILESLLSCHHFNRNNRSARPMFIHRNADVAIPRIIKRNIIVSLTDSVTPLSLATMSTRVTCSVDDFMLFSFGFIEMTYIVRAKKIDDPNITSIGSLITKEEILLFSIFCTVMYSMKNIE